MTRVGSQDHSKKKSIQYGSDTVSNDIKLKMCTVLYFMSIGNTKLKRAHLGTRVCCVFQQHQFRQQSVTALRLRQPASIGRLRQSATCILTVDFLMSHKFQVTRGYSHLFPLNVYIIYWPVHRLHIFIKSIRLLKKTWHNSEGHSLHDVLEWCRDWSTGGKVVFFMGPATQRGVMASSFLIFLDHTQRRTTVGMTPLYEWSARRRDLYLTTHDTHNRQISMRPGGIRTHDLSRRAAADLRLRPRSYWDRQIVMYACWKWKSTGHN